MGSTYFTVMFAVGVCLLGIDYGWRVFNDRLGEGFTFPTLQFFGLWFALFGVTAHLGLLMKLPAYGSALLGGVVAGLACWQAERRALKGEKPHTHTKGPVPTVEQLQGYMGVTETIIGKIPGMVVVTAMGHTVKLRAVSSRSRKRIPAGQFVRIVGYLEDKTAVVELR